MSRFSRRALDRCRLDGRRRRRPWTGGRGGTVQVDALLDDLAEPVGLVEGEIPAGRAAPERFRHGSWSLMTTGQPAARASRMEWPKLRVGKRKR